MTDTQPIGQTATPDWDHWLAQPTLHVNTAAWISLNVNPSLLACRYIAEKYMDYYRSGGELRLPSDSELHCLHDACMAQKDGILGSMFFPDSDAERHYRRLFKAPDQGTGSVLSEEFSFRLSFLFGPKRCPSLSDKTRDATISPQDFAAFCVEKCWPIPWRLAECGGIRRTLESEDVGLALRRELWTLTEAAHYLCGYSPYPDDRTRYPSPPVDDEDVSEMERRIRDAIDVGTLASFRDGTGFRPQDVAAWATFQGCCPEWLSPKATDGAANAKPRRNGNTRKTGTLPTIIMALAERTGSAAPANLEDLDKHTLMDLVIDYCDKADVDFIEHGSPKKLHQIVFPADAHQTFSLHTMQNNLKEIRKRLRGKRASVTKMKRRK